MVAGVGSRWAGPTIPPRRDSEPDGSIPSPVFSVAVAPASVLASDSRTAIESLAQPQRDDDPQRLGPHADSEIASVRVRAALAWLPEFPFHLCGSYPASFQMASASGDARYCRSALAAAGSLAWVEMNPTTATGVQICRGRTPTMSYLSLSGSMSLSMSMPMSISPFSSRLLVLMALFVAVGEMPWAPGPSST